MITKSGLYQLKRYCSEDITKIKGFKRAMKDKTNTKYVCHHRMETENLDGSKRDIPLGVDELKAKNLYFNRPANELVIITIKEHAQLHHQAAGNQTYKNKKQARKARLTQMKNYKAAHKEEIRLWTQEYYKEHKEELIENMKRYNKEHKLEHKVTCWACINHWPNPDDAIYPKTWTKEEIKDYKRRYKNKAS